MDPILLEIVVFGLLMAAIALVGGLFVLLPERVLARLLKPMVAFAAGSLIGGAVYHMLPKSMATQGPAALHWFVAGFAAFFALDQLFEWHHCHKPPSAHIRPLGPLLLVADGIHNFLGGLAIGALFLVDPTAAMAAWTAAALHEIPQEIGDYGAIVHSGFSRTRALWFNFLSALTFPLGGVVAWLVGQRIEVGFLVALGAGSFVYIAAADLLPEVKRAERLGETLKRFALFAAGVVLMAAFSPHLEAAG